MQGSLQTLFSFWLPKLWLAGVRPGNQVGKESPLLRRRAQQARPTHLVKKETEVQRIDMSYPSLTAGLWLRIRPWAGGSDSRALFVFPSWSNTWRLRADEFSPDRNRDPSRDFWAWWGEQVFSSQWNQSRSLCGQWRPEGGRTRWVRVQEKCGDCGNRTDEELGQFHKQRGYQERGRSEHLEIWKCGG